MLYRFLKTKLSHAALHDFPFWTLRFRRIQGHPFSFADHEYLRQIYAEHHDYLVIEKAAQMGASEFAISKAIWTCLAKPGIRVIYFFPTDQDVRDFSADRVAPTLRDLEDNDGLLGAHAPLPLLVSPEPRLPRRRVLNVGLRQIGNSAIYFRGMYSKVRMKSVPADFLVFDELDEAPPRAKWLAKERLSHSPLRWILELSTPSLPDYGIDVEFRQSDQRHWHLRCDCPDGVVLELSFPDCIAQRGARVSLRCPQCGKEPLDPRRGAWIAHYPSRTERRGYHLSQLFSTALPLEEIWREYQTTRNLAEFHNSKLGLPYAGDRMPLTRDLLLACVADHRQAGAGRNCLMGVDQGRDLHVVVAQPEADRLRLICVRRLRDSESQDVWRELANLMRRFDVAMCVVDLLPNLHSARRFAEDFRGRVSTACYTPSAHHAATVSAGEVRPNRTESLDRTVQTILRRELLLPRLDEEVEELIRHLSALAKIQEEDPGTGEMRFRYTAVGEDHYAHALNYLLIASDLLRRRVANVVVGPGPSR